jgi:hypothetical protein
LFFGFGRLGFLGLWVFLGGFVGGSGEVLGFDGGFYCTLEGASTVFGCLMGVFCFWVFGGGFYCIMEGASTVFECLMEVFCLWVFFCGLVGLFLCILHVYLGAPYAFFNKISYLSKKDLMFKVLSSNYRSISDTRHLVTSVYRSPGATSGI